VETHLRLILFLVGVIILTLVALDVLKQRNLKKQQDELKNQKELEPMLGYEDRQQVLDFGEEYNDEYWHDSETIVQKESITSEEISRDSIKATEKDNKTEKDIFALFVMAREPKGFEGSKLKKILETANLMYGKMNIFHKFDDNNKENILFSVASAVEPGKFDLEKLNIQFIPGVTIFMVPTMVSAPKAFDAMVRTAKQLAFSLNGELRDQYHKPLTLQIIDKYKHDILYSLQSPLSRDDKGIL